MCLFENEIRITDGENRRLKSARVPNSKDWKVCDWDTARIVSHVIANLPVIDINASNESSQDRVGINGTFDIEEYPLLDWIVHCCIRVQE